jgi:hypothetical protein
MSALHTQDWSGFSVGDGNAELAAAGWTQGTIPPTCTVVAEAAAPSGQALLMEPATSTLRFIRDDAVSALLTGSPATVEGFVALRHDSSTSRFGIGKWNSTTSLLGISFRRLTGGMTVQIIEDTQVTNPGNSPTSVATGLSNTAVVLCRFQFYDTDKIRARAWLEGDSEPTTWTSRTLAAAWSLSHVELAVSNTAGGDTVVMWYGVGVDRIVPTPYDPAGAQQGAASLSGSGTATAAAVVVRQASVALAGSGAVTAAGVRVRQASASLSGGGTATAAAVRVRQASATLSGAGTASASAVRVRQASAALSGSGTATATPSTPTTAVQGAAALSGAGTLTAGARVVRRASAALSGGGSVAAEAKGVRRASAALTGSGTISAAAVQVRRGAAVLSGAGAASAEARRVRRGSAALSGSGVLVVFVGAPSRARVAFPGAAANGGQLGPSERGGALQQAGQNGGRLAASARGGTVAESERRGRLT